MSSQKRIKAYDDTKVGQIRARLETLNNNQPGDVVKGAKIIVDILTESGVAEGRQVPERVALGSDCVPYIRGKLVETEELLKEWEEITTKTDHE
jgi:hypothetical protein